MTQTGCKGKKNLFTSLFTKGNSDYNFDSNTAPSNTLPSVPPEIKNKQVLKISDTINNYKIFRHPLLLHSTLVSKGIIWPIST